MSNQWLRLWHDMPNDPKWRTIARISRQPIVAVKATYLHLLVCASGNDPRGEYCVLHEDIASALDLDEADVDAIIAAMQGRVLEGKKLSGWEKRQPLREDGTTTNGKNPGSNYIYFVATTENDAIKVGISRNPWSRVKDLQTGSPSKFTLLTTFKTEARSEFELHDFFSESRLSGEWFRRSNALNSLISRIKNGDFKTTAECIEFLKSLPVHDFVATVGNYGRSVATTKDKEKDKDKDTEKMVNTTISDEIVVAGDEAASPIVLRDAPASGKPDCPHQQIIALYHEILPMCPQIRDWTPARAQQLRARWNEDAKRQNLDYWREFFGYVAGCPFLVGASPTTPGRRAFVADLEWLTKAANFAKVREGRYES